MDINSYALSAIYTVGNEDLVTDWCVNPKQPMGDSDRCGWVCRDWTGLAVEKRSFLALSRDVKFVDSLFRIFPLRRIEWIGGISFRLDQLWSSQIFYIPQTREFLVPIECFSRAWNGDRVGN